MKINPRKRPGTGARAIARDKLDARIEKLAEEVRAMQAPVVEVYDREKGVGAIPKNLRCYVVTPRADAAGSFSPSAQPAKTR